MIRVRYGGTNECELEIWQDSTVVVALFLLKLLENKELYTVSVWGLNSTYLWGLSYVWKRRQINVVRLSVCV